jgi:hypothetical protein
MRGAQIHSHYRHIHSTVLDYSYELTIQCHQLRYAIFRRDK